MSRPKILIVDQDETAFQVRKCIASVSAGLIGIELLYARDASEAISIIEKKLPHAVLLSTEDGSDEAELLIDNLSTGHPPILIQGDESLDKLHIPEPNNIKKIPNDDSIDSIHQTLKLLIALAETFTGNSNMTNLH